MEWSIGYLSFLRSEITKKLQVICVFWGALVMIFTHQHFLCAIKESSEMEFNWCHSIHMSIQSSSPWVISIRSCIIAFSLMSSSWHTWIAKQEVLFIALLVPLPSNSPWIWCIFYNIFVHKISFLDILTNLNFNFYITLFCTYITNYNINIKKKEKKRCMCANFIWLRK